MAPKQAQYRPFCWSKQRAYSYQEGVRSRPSDRKGKTSKRVSFVRSLIREVAGFAPYEKKITELLNVGNPQESEKEARGNV